MSEFFTDVQILPRGRYLQFAVGVKFLDDAIIRSNEPEEVLTYRYQKLGNRFIIPWRKVKGKVRRMAMEKMRGLNISPACALKDALCMSCPCCFLFGGTGKTGEADAEFNLLSRVLGDTFISRTKDRDIKITSYTANAVDERTLTTGQALMTINKVPAETEFVGVITLRDPTSETATILADSLLRVTRLGASTREWGRCQTSILGYVLADREGLSSYEAIEDGKDVWQPLETLSLNLSGVDDAYSRFNNQVKELIQSLPVKQQTKGKGAKSKT